MSFDSIFRDSMDLHGRNNNWYSHPTSRPFPLPRCSGELLRFHASETDQIYARDVSHEGHLFK
jgi:hypothetical protein